MAAKRTYPAPSTGVVMSPKGVAPGVGVLYVNGKPTQFVSLKTPLAPGWGVEYQGGKAVRFIQPGQASAPGAAPAAGGGGSGGAVIPPDPTYEAEQAGLERQRELTLAGLAQQRSAGLSDFGFREGSYDPGAASYGSLTFDPNNPFSKASLLKQTYDRNRRASAQSMAAAGQQYAGAFQNQQDLVNRGQLQSEDALQKSLARFLAQNTQQWGQAGVDYTTGLARSASESAARASSSPLYQPSAPAAAASPAAPAATITRPSASHGGSLWRYRKGASGKLIPVGPA